MILLLPLAFAVIVAGVLLVRRFRGQATATGIGSFRLIPLAGLGYLAGVMAVGLGLLLLLLLLTIAISG